MSVHVKLSHFGSAAAIVLAGILPAASQADVLLDFDTESEYTDNFTELRYGGQNTWKATSGQTAGVGVDARFGAYVKTETSGTTTLMGYNGGDVLTETIELDYWTETLRSTDPATFGIVTRIQDDNSGILGLMSFQGTTSLRLRLFYGGSYSTTTNSAGTAFYDATFDLSNGTFANAVGAGGVGSANALSASNHKYPEGYWLSINPYHITLEQTAGDDPTFNLTVADDQGLVASTGDVVFTINDNFNTAGGIGMRIGNGGGTIRTGFDNFTLASVPEPASLALMGLGCLLIVPRRRLQ